MRNKSVLPIISLALLAAAEPHPQRRNVETNLTGQDAISFNLNTMSSMTNIGDEYLPMTKRKRRLGREELKRREEPEPITVKLDKIPRGDLWTGRVTFDDGGPIPIRGTHYDLILDTSLGDFRLMTSSSKGNNKDLKLYKPPTAKQEQAKDDFNGDYVTPQSINSATFEDTVYISGVRVTDVHIVGLAQVDATRRIGADGVIGMSFDTNPAVSQLHFFSRFLSQYPRHPHVFAFYLGDHAEFHLGGIKESAYPSHGKIYYHQIVPINGQLLLWAIEKGDIFINKDHSLIMERAFINTGSQAILGPYDQVKSFYGKIHGSFEGKYQGRPCFMLRCLEVKPPVISLKWGDMPRSAYDGFAIGSGEICIGGIQAHEYPFDPDLWSIGTRWLKGKYVIFNKKEKKVGFMLPA